MTRQLTDGDPQSSKASGSAAERSPRSIPPIVALILGGLSVVFCNFFIDRQVARFVEEHRFYSYEFLRWPGIVSDWATYLAIAAIIAVAAWRLRQRGGRLQTLCLAISVNLVVTNAIKWFLKGMFGRTWPGQWPGENPSLIGNGVYGFYPLHFDKAHGSFPSGHAAAALAIISILWLSEPRGRWLYALLGLATCAALVGMNFHFVGDVIAGAMLGCVTGYYATRIFGLLPEKIPQDQT